MLLTQKLDLPKEVLTSELSEYDLIGFGSGIYYGRRHKTLLNLGNKLPQAKNHKVFIFSTSRQEAKEKTSINSGEKNFKQKATEFLGNLTVRDLTHLVYSK